MRRRFHYCLPLWGSSPPSQEKKKLIDAHWKPTCNQTETHFTTRQSGEKLKKRGGEEKKGRGRVSLIRLYLDVVKQRECYVRSKSLRVSLSRPVLNHLWIHSHSGTAHAEPVITHVWAFLWHTGSRTQAGAKDAGTFCSFGVLLPVCVSLYRPSSLGWGCDG